MQQITLTKRQYRKASTAYAEATGRAFLDDHTMTCYAWPVCHPCFGTEVITPKNYEGAIHHELVKAKSIR